MRWLLLFALFAASAVHADCGVTPPALNIRAQPPQRVKSYVRFQGYEITIVDSCDDIKGHSDIEISKYGRLLYAETGEDFAVGYPLEQNQPPDAVKLKPGDDITGLGQPELLVSASTGGAHCCYSFDLIRLMDPVVRLQRIPLYDADESSFVRRPGVKGLVLVTNDYSDFAYFPASFAGSPAGRVFLSFQDGKFRPNLSLMKADAPKAGVLKKCAALFKQSRAWKSEQNAGQPLGMWYYATDLIYTGHAEEAWMFLDAVWGGGKAEKRKYIGEYKSRLKKSVYYPDLMQLQQAPFSDAGQKIDWEKHCFDYMHG
jgi:hypothetical protein